MRQVFIDLLPNLHAPHTEDRSNSVEDASKAAHLEVCRTLATQWQQDDAWLSLKKFIQVMKASPDSARFTWRDIVSGKMYSCSNMQAEICSALLTYASLLSLRAKKLLFKGDEGSHASQVYLKAAGCLRLAQVLENTEVQPEWSFCKSTALAEMETALLIGAQTALALDKLKTSLSPKHLKVAASLLESNLKGYLTMNHRHALRTTIFVEEFPRVTLFLYYVLCAEYEKAQGRANAAEMLQSISLEVFGGLPRHIQSTLQVTHFMPPARARSVRGSLDRWKHKCHDCVLYLQDSSQEEEVHSDNVFFLQPGVSELELDELKTSTWTPLTSSSPPSPGGLQSAKSCHHSFHRRSISTVDISSLARKNEKRLSRVISVEDWKYGMERLNDKHHKMDVQTHSWSSAGELSHLRTQDGFSSPSRARLVNFVHGRSIPESNQQHANENGGRDSYGNNDSENNCPQDLEQEDSTTNSTDGDDDSSDEYHSSCCESEMDDDARVEEERNVKRTVRKDLTPLSNPRSGSRKRHSILDEHGKEASSIRQLLERRNSAGGFMVLKDSQNHQDKAGRNSTQGRNAFPKPFHVKYDPFTGKSERVFHGSACHINPLSSKKGSNHKRPCALCGLPFNEECLPGKATRKAVSRLRKSWGVRDFHLSKRKEVPAFMYSTERVCVFCEQFFVPNSKAGHTLKGEAGNQNRQDDEDRAVEEMILRSIQVLVERKFEELSDSERKGILQNASQLGPVSPHLENVALGKFPTQSSTLMDNSAFCALNAVDGNFLEAPAKTKHEDAAFWEINLGQIYSMSNVRIWLDVPTLQLKPIWVLVSRTPFQPGVSLTQAIQHADLRQRFEYASRILEWQPRHEVTQMDYRGRFLRVQLERPGQLSILQCQIFGKSLLSLMSPTSPTPTDKIKVESVSPTSPSGNQSPMLSPKFPPRVLQDLEEFTFCVDGDPFLAGHTEFHIICPLICPKKQRQGQGGAGTSDVEAVLRRCNEGYDRTALLTKFLTALEQAVLWYIHQKLRPQEAAMQQKGKTTQIRKVSPEASKEFALLKSCFQTCVEATTTTTAGNHESPCNVIPSLHFSTLFRYSGRGFGFVEESVLLWQRFESNELHLATDLFSHLPFVQRQGVDWAAFLLYVLFMDQLLDLHRGVRKAARPEKRSNNSPENSITQQDPGTPKLRALGRPSSAAGGGSGSWKKKALLTRPSSAAGAREKPKERKAVEITSPRGITTERLRPASAAIIRRKADQEIRDISRRLRNAQMLNKVRKKSLTKKKHVDTLLDREGGQVSSHTFHRNRKIPCALCEKDFRVENLCGQVTRRAVLALRSEWARDKTGKVDTPKFSMPKSLLYDMVKVCGFCHQFFIERYAPEAFKEQTWTEITKGKKPYEPMPDSFLYPHVISKNKSTKRLERRKAQGKINPWGAVFQFELEQQKAMCETSSEKTTELSLDDGRTLTETLATVNDLLQRPVTPPARRRVAKKQGLPRSSAAAQIQTQKSERATVTKVDVQLHPDMSVRAYSMSVGVKLDMVARVVQEELNGKTSWRELTRKEKVGHISAVAIQRVVRGWRVRTQQPRRGAQRKKQSSEAQDILQDMERKLREILGDTHSQYSLFS